MEITAERAWGIGREVSLLEVDVDSSKKKKKKRIFFFLIIMKMVGSERLGRRVSRKQKTMLILKEYFLKTKMDRFSGTGFDI